MDEKAKYGVAYKLQTLEEKDKEFCRTWFVNTDPKLRNI